MKYLIKPLAKSVLIPSGLTAAVSAANTVIQKGSHCSGATTVIISNKEMENIMNIVKSHEESGLLIKCISEKIENDPKEQKKWIS